MPHPTHILAVAGLVSDAHGNVLIVRSPKRGWEFPGGQVEAGETLEEALVREIEEESGITAAVTRLVAMYSNVGQRGTDGWPRPTILMADFLCDYISGDPRTSDESLEVRWVPRDTALGIIDTPAYKDRMALMLGFDGRVHYKSYVTFPAYELRTSRVF